MTVKVQKADLIVIGAGPAGSAAAIAASGLGMDVVLLDEAQAAGGQVYRAPPAGWIRSRDKRADRDTEAGNALRDRLAASRVRHHAGHSVWAVKAGFEVRTLSPAGQGIWTAPRLIVACGVTERIFPFPGWTTPGVIGLAAATNLLKSQQTLPGRDVVVAGAGPLLYAVPAAIIAGRGRVAAIADLASRGEWAKAVPSLVSAPSQAIRGFQWRLRLMRAGVPVHYRHHVVAASGSDSLDGVELGPVDAGGSPIQGGRRRRIAADALVVGHGLVPQVQITRLLRAPHRFDAGLGGWIPDRDGFGRTPVDGLYVAGDCTGVAGADPAALGGELAGLAAARDAGRCITDEFESAAASVTARLAGAGRVGRAMGRMMAPRSGLVAAITAETTVCRCEDVTRAQIEQAIDDGATDSNQVKSWTRCGMGPCQGRTCSEAASNIIVARLGPREEIGAWTARIPIRPHPLDQLAGSATYDEIWNSPAARIATSILPVENTRNAGPPGARDTARSAASAPETERGHG